MRQLFAAALFAAALLGPGAAEAQHSPAAQQVLDRAKAASGGAAAWNRIRGLHEVGEEGAAGFELWVDPLRYGLRQETPARDGRKLVQGYNGAAEWRVLEGGVLTGSDSGERAAQVRSDAFFAAYGYYFPGRFDLRGAHVGVRQHAGRSFDVLRIQPAGGRPRELWFDRRTGLLGRVVQPLSAATQRVTEVEDYRRVGGLLAPFRFTTTGSGLDKPLVRSLKSIDFGPASRERFSLPPPPEPAARKPR